MSYTLYEQIARKLVKFISMGKYPVGSLLPTEMELCAEYGASRQTIRAALKQLEELGLVSRTPRVGTRVTAATSSSGFSQSVATMEDLVQLAEHQTRIVQHVERFVMDQKLASELGCAPGSRWTRLEILRLDEENASPQPVGWTIAYVAEIYDDVPTLLQAAPKALISSLIEAAHGVRIDQVRQTIEAIILDSDTAGKLQVAAGSAALRIIRRYIDHSNEVFEVTVTVHPSERFACSMTLRRARS